MVSHQKPDYLAEAVGSLLAQTWQDWRGILWDSGALLDAGYFARWNDPRLTVLRSPEREIHAAGLEPAPFLFNETYRRGLVSSGVVCYLPDDDLLYPCALAAFADFFTRNPSAMACYASQDFGYVRDGKTVITGERVANHPAGRKVRGRRLDCVIDGGQFAHRAEVLAEVSWPEGPDTRTHADGVFMEAVGERWPILPLPVKVGMNRRTALSRYQPLR